MIYEMRATIFGKVQGVGMRAFVCREAIQLKLAGHVKNLADGSVEILAQGPKEDLEELIGKIQARFSIQKVEFDFHPID